MENPFEAYERQLNEVKELQLQTLQALKNSNGLTIEIITREELCKRLKITEPTAIRWEKKGLIPSIRIGSGVRYNWPKVISALEKH